VRADAVWTNMSGNIRFPDLPITMDDLKAEIVCFDETITEALDGSRTAFAAKRSQREVVTKKLRILGHYVEENCDNDPATFLTSGFELASTTRVPSQPLPPTVVRKITQGKSGTLWIKMQAVPKARKYELRHGEKGTDVGGRKIEIYSSARSLVAINDLMPGKIYEFQVRAYGTLGYTPWSNTMSRMCT
jgi:hypothetical protein